MSTHIAGVTPGAFEFEFVDECDQCGDSYFGSDRVEIIRLTVPGGILDPNMGLLTFCDLMCLFLWCRGGK